MKQIIRAIVLVIVAAGVGGGLIFTYRVMRQERDAEAGEEAPVVSPSHLRRGPDGRMVLELDAATQARLELRTARLKRGSVPREITANARVLEASALTAQLDALRAAEATLAAARKPYERARRLYENGRNTSVATVEAAEARVIQARLARDAARHRLADTWGPALARRADLADLAEALRQRAKALIRVDLLAAEPLPPATNAVRLLHLTGEPAAAARMLGVAPRTDAVVASGAWLALAETPAAALAPGTLLTARIALGGREVGAVLPRNSVVRQSGRAWVYVKQSDTTFTRREVSLDRPHPAGWLVAGEWTEPVVVAGAQSLLSEELKGTIRMRD